MNDEQILQNEVSLEALCDLARGAIASAKQWDSLQHADVVLKDMIKAEAIIEIVEVEDCGSIGGFSDGMDKLANHTVEQRVDFLYNKYVRGQR